MEAFVISASSSPSASASLRLSSISEASLRGGEEKSEKGAASVRQERRRSSRETQGEVGAEKRERGRLQDQRGRKKKKNVLLRRPV